MKTIILTGGGTGGHVMPHLAILDDLKKHFDRVVYIGSNGIEKEIMKNQGVIFEEIPAYKLKRDKFFENLTLPFKVIKSIKKSKEIIKRYEPSVIFSKGGFVSVPVAIAGKQLGIPVVSHESDYSLGLSNKIIYKFCTKFLTTFEDTIKGQKKVVHTGPPIRKELFDATQKINFNNNNPTILIMGGSSGAKSLNELVFKSVDELSKKFNIIHLTGKGKSNKTIKNDSYLQIEYAKHIEKLLNSSDLIVTRAGSNTIFEVLALKKPMILIPLNNKATRGDQVENAKYFEKKNWAKTLDENSLTKETFIEEITKTYKNKNNYVKTQNEYNITANEKILNEILSCQKDI